MKYTGFFLAGVILAGAVGASAAVSPAEQSMERIAGVYKHRFTSGIIVPGREETESYQAENIIEIVPYDREHVYLRVHLDFFNGHTCGIHGMARFEGGMFVHRDPQPPTAGDPPCVLKVGEENGKLTLTDRPSPDAARTCAAYCGARGSLDYEIGMDQRRPIRYLERLKASRQYKEAQHHLLRSMPASP
ncbi:hypothetical protein [Telluria beijingensis]|uniref:hypothetical protein n=1 Tax=Telluria beijingensis TaxID=3068633 RepID=UPI002795973F|nr:hypothetical protein [Massilia sp. REN29]